MQTLTGSPYRDKKHSLTGNADADVDKKFIGFLGEYSTFLICTRLVLTAEFRGLASLSTCHFLKKKYFDPFRV